MRLLRFWCGLLGLCLLLAALGIADLALRV
jgi:hypothetical protein